MLALHQLAFVDIETTGNRHLSDYITEIAVIYWHQHQPQPQVFHTLINPGVSIPSWIQSLTGINNDMVQTAPHFDHQLADNLAQIFQNRILVAHHARFDYAFIKTAFKRLDRPFHTPQLCTLKLARLLYPHHHQHRLDQLIKRHRLNTAQRHRAYSDAHVLYQFWQHLHTEFDDNTLSQACHQIMQKPSLPPHLNIELLQQIKDSYGVYLIYGENNLPLYIGKSKHVKTRLLSHFRQDIHNSKEMTLSQQARHIQVITCQGEVDALLTEAEQIKAQQPILNRRLRRQRHLFSWQIQTNSHGYDYLILVSLQKQAFYSSHHFYGLFHSKTEAKKAILASLHNSSLCLQTLTLEKGRHQQPCFRYQLHQCHGACIEQIKPQEHNQQLHTLLCTLKIAHWPFTHMAYIQEQHKYHLFDHWIYLGSVEHKDQLTQLASSANGKLDKDIYQIIRRHQTKLQPYNPQ